MSLLTVLNPQAIWHRWLGFRGDGLTCLIWRQETQICCQRPQGKV